MSLSIANVEQGVACTALVIALANTPSAAQASNHYSAQLSADDLSLSTPDVKQLTTEQLLRLGEQKICLKRVDPRVIQNQRWAHSHLKLRKDRKRSSSKMKQFAPGLRRQSLSFKMGEQAPKFAAPKPELDYGMGVKSGDLMFKVEYRF